MTAPARWCRRNYAETCTCRYCARVRDTEAEEATDER